MKALSKTLVAASLAFGAGAVNADILQDNSVGAEAWLSVYDSTNANTFTLDLGVAGVTLGTLINNVGNNTYGINVDLTQFSDWNAFIGNADQGAIKYAVAVAGVNGDNKNSFMVTGADTGFFQGVSDSAVSNAMQSLNAHANGINVDAGFSGNSSLNLTMFVNDNDAPQGSHEDGAGSANLWGNTSYNPNGAYNEAIAFNYVHSVTANRNTSAVQDVFSQKWMLEGNSLNFGSNVSAVPLPAAAWMFGAGLMGLLGLNRKRSAA